MCIQQKKQVEQKKIKQLKLHHNKLWQLKIRTQGQEVVLKFNDLFLLYFAMVILSMLLRGAYFCFFEKCIVFCV